jgi:hypothetical protein
LSSANSTHRWIDTRSTMKNSLALVASTCMLAVTVGCASTGPVSEPDPVPRMNLVFNPPTEAAPGSANIVLAVVAPQWTNPGSDAAGRTSELVLNNFRESMKNEFMKIVISRGFTTKGDVLSNRNDLLYGDKMTSDLIITPNLDVRFRFTDLKGGGMPVPIIGYFAVDGSAVVEGRVVLDAYETVTNERLWTKPITLDPISITWTGEARNRDVTLKDTPDAWAALALNDPGFQRALIPELNNMFAAVMRTTYNYLDPAEFAVLKSQADELKSRAVSTIR